MKWFIGILKETGFLRDSSMLVIRTIENNKKRCIVATFLRNEASFQVPQKIRNSKFFDNSQENILKVVQFFKNSRVTSSQIF